jgi:hypothetical protein
MISGASQTVDLSRAIKSSILRADEREPARRQAAESLRNIEHPQYVQERRAVLFTGRSRTM